MDNKTKNLIYSFELRSAASEAEIIRFYNDAKYILDIFTERDATRELEIAGYEKRDTEQQIQSLQTGVQTIMKERFHPNFNAGFPSLSLCLQYNEKKHKDIENRIRAEIEPFVNLTAKSMFSAPVEPRKGANPGDVKMYQVNLEDYKTKSAKYIAKEINSQTQEVLRKMQRVASMHLDVDKQKQRLIEIENYIQELEPIVRMEKHFWRRYYEGKQRITDYNLYVEGSGWYNTHEDFLIDRTRLKENVIREVMAARKISYADASVIVDSY